MSAALALDRLDQATRTDATLPAAVKCLFVAAIYAVKGDEARTGEWLAHARAAGATGAQIESLAISVLLSRGRAPMELLARTGVGGSLAAEPGAAEPEVGEMRDYFAGVFGHIPDRIGLLIEHHRGGLRAYYELRLAGLGDNALGALYSELALFVVNAADFQTEFARIHAGFARQRGATEAQLVEAGVCAIAHAGVAAWLPASEAIIQSRNEG